MPSAIETAAQVNRDAAEGIARTTRAMPAEKAVWKPLDQGRSALDQIVECGHFNRLGAYVLNRRALPPMDGEDSARFKAENDTVDKALAFLQSGTDELVAAIEAFPESDLGRTITLPFGGGMNKTMAEIMYMASWNMTYHHGQINYIQTLYGDKDMH